MTETPPGLIIVGRVRKAHGIRGELVVEAITDEPDAIFAPGRRLIAGTPSGDRARDGRELHVGSARPFKGGLIVHFDEIEDRTEADQSRDRLLLVHASEVTPPAEDEIYVHELQGMRVELESGELIGTVVDTYDLPQGLMLDVRRETGTVLIPYDHFVTSVDRHTRILQVNPPVGLLD